MEGIILAAGMGSRLGKLGEGKPKGMLSFLGEPLIGWQIAALRAAGIESISIVRGYRAEQINFPGVRYFENSEYQSTNMVYSLVTAREVLETASSDIIVSYADIIYEARLLRSLVESRGEVGIVVDTEWIAYWKARSEDWLSDVESLTMDQEFRIQELGTPRVDIKRAEARYVGLLRFTPKAIGEFLDAFDQLHSRLWGNDEKWRASPTFKKAYMTCMLQELIDRGIDVRGVPVQHGWLEFDTAEDYEKGILWSKDGRMEQFIDLTAIR